MTTYSVYLNTPQGVRVAPLPFLRLWYRLSAAQVGALEIDVPTGFDTSLVGRDWQIEVWRNTDGGAEYLEGNKKWLVRKVRRTYAKENTVTIYAVCPNDLLRRRIVAYPAGSAYTGKTGAAGDTLLDLARENLGTGVTSDRDTTQNANIGALLAIQEDSGVGASLQVACARDNLLETARKICEASITAGQYLAFDIQWNGTSFVLQVYPQQIGIDHRYPGGLNPLIFGQDFGSFTDVEVVDDYTEEATVVIAGAQGIAETRTIAVATDTTRLNASPLNQCEIFYQGNSAGYDSTVLADLADGKLRASRPLRLATGRINETPAVRYGRDWRWGDYVTIQIERLNYDARIDTVTVEVQGGRETIDAGVRIDG